MLLTVPYVADSTICCWQYRMLLTVSYVEDSTFCCWQYLMLLTVPYVADSTVCCWQYRMLLTVPVIVCWFLAQHFLSGKTKQWRTQEFCSVRRGGGSTNPVQDRGQRGWGSGGGSPPVRGSAQFSNEWILYCDLVVTDVFSTDLGIRLSFVRTMELLEGGEVNTPQTTPRYLIETKYDNSSEAVLHWLIYVQHIYVQHIYVQHIYVQHISILKYRCEIHTLLSTICVTPFHYVPFCCV
jgi:hypothetical protein